MRTTNTIAVARLRWVALGAAELLAAHGEYDMATRIGVTPWLAWLFPIGLGVYAYCAFATRSRADVRAALGLMIACQALAHLLAVDVLPRHWTLVVTVSAVAPIICWRVHHLGEHASMPDAAPPAMTTTSPADDPTVAPVVEAAPIPTPPATRPAPRPRVRVAPSRRPRRVTHTAAARYAPAAAVCPPATPRRRTREETQAMIQRLRATHRGITQKEIATRLGCSTRWVRECSAA